MTTRRSELEAILKEESCHPSCRDGGDPECSLVAQLNRWADRWAGRPSREQIVSVVKDWWMEVGGAEVADVRGFADRILALYPAPTSEKKRVSRREIRELLDRHKVKTEPHYSPPGCSASDCLMDDLCALFGVEEEKPEWCTHMNKAWMKENPWDFCPYCGSIRPEKRPKK